jgi:hypothetical protein
MAGDVRRRLRTASLPHVNVRHELDAHAIVVFTAFIARTIGATSAWLGKRRQLVVVARRSSYFAEARDQRARPGS